MSNRPKRIPIVTQEDEMSEPLNLESCTTKLHAFLDELKVDQPGFGEPDTTDYMMDPGATLSRFLQRNPECEPHWNTLREDVELRRAQLSRAKWRKMFGDKN